MANRRDQKYTGRNPRDNELDQLQSDVNVAEADIDQLETEVQTPSTGLLDRTTAAEADIDQLETEVQTPVTGLLDRVTATEAALGSGPILKVRKLTSVAGGGAGDITLVGDADPGGAEHGLAIAPVVQTGDTITIEDGALLVVIGDGD